MKSLFVLLSIALAAPFAAALSQPSVTIANLAIVREEHGWRVQESIPGPIHWNLLQGDLILRIDGRNAAETGPMQMASYLNEDHRRAIPVFVKRDGIGRETTLRAIAGRDLDPAMAKPFAHPAKGFDVPDLEIHTLKNGSITLDQYKGKWVLLEFGASWCPPSIERVPEVLSLARKEKDRMAVLMVAMDYRPAALQELMNRLQVDIPVAAMGHMAPLPVQLGVSVPDFFAELPAFVLIRPDGEVAQIVIGRGDPGEFTHLVEAALSQPE